MSGRTLAEITAKIEAICAIAEESDDGYVSETSALELEDAKVELPQKVDNYITLLDSLKAREAVQKEQKDRLARGLRITQNLTTRIKDRVKWIAQNTAVPLRGKLGCLYLHKSPKRLDIDFATEDKTVYSAIDKALVEMEPSLNRYVKTLTFYILDKEAIKADIEKGVELSWARYSQDSHIRVKG